jgi:hypothetical protein
MKTVASILVSILFMVSAAVAGNGTANNKNHKKPANKESSINQRINGMIGLPLDVLHGNSQSVMISYSVDENNIMHVKEISGTNTELKQYIYNHLDGKAMKNTEAQGTNGVVKVHFNASKGNNIYLQY